MLRSRALVVLAAVAALVLGVAGCGDDGDEAGDGEAPRGDTATTTAPETTTTTTARETSTTARDGAAPSEAVAVTRDGEAVLLDAETGEVVRVLASGVRVDDPAKNAVAVAPERSPDGGRAYIVFPSEPGGEGLGEIRSFALDETGDDGGTPDSGDEGEVVVREGSYPEVSPDGSRLAFVTTRESEGPGSPLPEIVVRDLETGDETVIGPGEERELVFVSDLAWLGDDRISLVAGEVQTGVWTVPADAASFDEAERVGPTGRDEGASWNAVAAWDDGELAVAETCCDLPPERELVLLVDLATGDVEGGLLPAERGAQVLDADAGGGHLLLVDDFTLFRWADGDPESERVLDEVVVAAW